MFYVPISISMIAQSKQNYYTCMYYYIYFVLITHILCFIAVILNRAYSVGFLCFMSRCFTLVCRKIAKMS